MTLAPDIPAPTPTWAITADVRRPAVRIGVLGPLDVAVAGRPVALKGRRQKIILAVLALNANRVVSVDRLADAVWGERRPATADGQVVICISALRRMLAAAGAPTDLVATASPGYVLRAEPREVDVVLAETLAGQAKAAQDAGDLGGAAELLGRACGLWRGRVLHGWGSTFLDDNARWWEDRWFTLYERRVQLDLALGRHAEVIDELGAAVRDRPAREPLRAYLMVAQYRCGRRGEALDTYRAGLDYLRRELGIEPSAELRDLHAGILRDDTTTITSRYAATPAAGQDAVPAQLPGRDPHFVGRDAEIVRLDALRQDRSGRGLVTVVVVTGPGGVGKSSLAVRWAHRVAHHFPDGQLFVDLRGHDLTVEPLRADVVMARVLRAFGVREDRIPAHPDERTALYRTVVGRRRVLLVLDNAGTCEQVRPLLPGAGRSCVVVASRRPLHDLAVRDGATELRLGVLADEASVALMTAVSDRPPAQGEARAVRSLARLCEGLPLALRIVGAKLDSGTFGDAHELLARLADERRRLDELSYGQLAVRATFAISYRDLPAAAAAMFRRLGRVEAPFITTSVAAALLEVAEPEADAVLDQLVDAQLVERVHGVHGRRCRMHDLVRLYARERAHAED